MQLTQTDIIAANAATAAEHAATAAFWAAEFETSNDSEDAAKADFYRRLAEEHEAYASPAQLIHKSELATKAASASSPEIRRLAEMGLFYSSRALPGDGRICRQYRRALRAQAHAEAGLLPIRETFLDL